MIMISDAGRSPAVEGIYVAAVTPFRDDKRFSVDLDAYLAHTAWLAEQGVDGLVAFGTNGEGPSLAAWEKRRVLDVLAREAGSLPIVATVAEGNLPDTLDQVAYLNDLPLRALLVLPPYYFRPVPIKGLRVFYERVLAVARHPVIVYHIPKYAVGVPADLVASLPVWGVKDSGGEAGYASGLYAAGRGVMLGTEHDLPAGLRTAHGAISGLANIVPEQVAALYRHVRAGDTDAAAGLSAHLQRVRAMTKQHTASAVLKRVAERRHGHPMGTVRPPLVDVPSGFDAGAALALALGATR
jgi:4-hydroxy-tetrahydrodipicolinate synthase